MKKLLVVMFATHMDKLMPTYLDQLDRGGVARVWEVVDCSKDWESFGKIGPQLERMEKALEKYPDYEYYVFTDAHDMLFFGTEESLCNQIPDEEVLIGSERTLYPDTLGYSLAPWFPWRGTPFRYVNWGVRAGRPENFRYMIDCIKQHEAYHPMSMDQAFANMMLLTGSAPFWVDNYCDLQYCMFRDPGNLAVVDGTPTLKMGSVTTTPHFIHFNGKCDPTEFLKKVGLEVL